MGFDIEKIPIIKNTLKTSDGPLPLFNNTPADIEIVDGDEHLSLEELFLKRNLKFEPNPPWKGHVEKEITISEKITA
jgi:hypothetical protein